MHKGKTLAWIVVGLLSLAAARAQAQPGYYPPGPPPPPPHLYRIGLMLGFGVGAGSMKLSCDGCPDALGGLGLEFHIGGMLQPNLALMFTASSVVHPFDQGGSISSNFFGGAIQFWANRIFWLRGGLGGGFLELNDEAGYTVDRTKAGGGILLAAGVELLQSFSFALDLSVQVTSVRFSDLTATNAALLLGFNWY